MLDNLSKATLSLLEGGKVPQDMQDEKIITLYKNKGDHSDCNSYHSISLLRIVGKVFAHITVHKTIEPC